VKDALGSTRTYDAVVVGAGPNGLAAAITMAEAGLSTLLVEAKPTIGGGMRTSELTIPGAMHDVCSAVHPLGLASPFFRSLDLARYGLEWIDSPTPLAHVMRDGTAALLEHSIAATAEGFGEDGQAYRDLVEPFVESAEALFPMILAPLRFPARPFLMARFGLSAIRSMRGLARARFRTERPSALLAGIAAHAMVPLDSLATASFAMVLAIAGHAGGWPIARGGSQAIANALAAHFEALGGEIVVDRPVRHLSELPAARAYLLDVSAKGLLGIAGDVLTRGYRARASRFRYGPGVFKVDWALRAPIPWKDPGCRRAVTVHLSGTLDDVSGSIRAVHEGRLAERPLVLVGQPSIVDGSRAPEGVHTAWAYCHVPSGSDVNALDSIESQIERFAPGFKDVVIARATKSATELESYDANFVGGDINAGLADAMQLFFRPMARFDPYATSAPHVFLCSSSTPPGGAVHGMCGYHAARSALRRRFGKRALALAPSPAQAPLLPAAARPR